MYVHCTPIESVNLCFFSSEFDQFKHEIAREWKVFCLFFYKKKIVLRS